MDITISYLGEGRLVFNTKLIIYFKNHEKPFSNFRECFL